MENVFEHFKGEEDFVKRMLEAKKSVLDHQTLYLTPFLDPRKQDILKSLIGKDTDFILEFKGWIEGSELKRAILAPSYFEIEKEDFKMVLVYVNYSKKYASLTHRDVLGALMHMGIKRELLGDIFIDQEDIYFVCDQAIFDYLRYEMKTIKHSKVTLEESHKELTKVQEYKVETFFVPSYRLDVLISAFYRLSRKKASDAIKAGYVKVNHKVVEESHFLCNNRDTISVRGFGRVQMVDTQRKTKQENHVIEGYFYK